jgi:hypothetical protein
MPPSALIAAAALAAAASAAPLSLGWNKIEPLPFSRSDHVRAQSAPARHARARVAP